MGPSEKHNRDQSLRSVVNKQIWKSFTLKQHFISFLSSLSLSLTSVVVIDSGKAAVAGVSRRQTVRLGSMLLDGMLG